MIGSNFCIIQGLIELRKVGVLAALFIKKRRYWPRDVNGQERDDYTKTKYIGDVAYLSGKLDPYNYDVFG